MSSHLARFCSASGMFAKAYVEGFAAKMRKGAASLMRIIRGNKRASFRAVRICLQTVSVWSTKHASLFTRDIRTSF